MSELTAKYLVLKGASGLGNRMLSALTAVMYARLTGRRLIADWSDAVYSDDGSNVFSRFFVGPSFRHGDDVPLTDSVTPAIWRGHLHESVPELRRRYRHLTRGRIRRDATARTRWRLLSSVDLTRLEHPEELAVIWGPNQRINLLRPHFRGEFAELSRMSTQAILSQLLAEELLLHPRIQARVDEIRTRHLEGPTVGVHLRVSDQRVRVEAILSELDALLAREPDLRIFAATDNIEAKEMMERRYPGVITAPHWYPPPGEPLHLSDERPDRVESGVESLVDLYLLGGCDYLVGDTTSSFTRVARLLMGARQENVIDVRPRANRRTRLAQEAWRRYAASDMVMSRILRKATKGQYPI